VRIQLVLAAATAATLGGFGVHRAARHFNPMIDLHIEHKPVFGLYAPSNPRGRRGAPPPPDAPAAKSPAELAKEGVANANMDFLFDGSMEGDFDRAYAQYAEFVKGWAASGAVDRTGGAHLSHPLAVKTHNIAENIPLAQERIAKQLNLGVTTIMFPGVESADEVKAGLAAMRFKSHGGVRPDDVGDAPKLWGMSEAEYKQKADLWPLNPNGELTNWTIVESKEGLKHIREIAAVKGIGVLWPGAGTLRGVFSTMENGQRKFDQAGWENAIQQVLAACKEFNVPCGYPANENDIEERMKQGFTVFVMNWGEPGFRTIELGKKLSGR
jgi:2-keto-3-deoxy-L-rhamnonate aldolase RhmA